MADGLNLRGAGDDEIDFQPLGVRPRPTPRPPRAAGAAAHLPRVAGDEIDFQTVAAASAQSRSAPQATISPYKPTLLKRLKNIFTEGIPRYSSRTVHNPKYGSMQLVTPEAAMTPSEQERHPILTGLGEVGGGLTAPENFALIAGTGGLGTLPGVAGRLLPRLVSGVFSMEMARNAYLQIPEFRDAIERGDSSEAQRIATHIVASGALSGLAGRHALRGRAATKSAKPTKRLRPIAALPEHREAIVTPAPKRAPVQREQLLRTAKVMGWDAHGRPIYGGEALRPGQSQLARPVRGLLRPLQPEPLETTGGKPVRVRTPEGTIRASVARKPVAPPTAQAAIDFRPLKRDAAPSVTRQKPRAEMVRGEAEAATALHEQKQPWQMTRAEWEKEFDKTRADPQGYATELGGMGRATSENGLRARRSTAKARQDFLKMNVPDECIHGLQIPARHYDVVRLAVERGESVPAEILTEYPDLARRGGMQSQGEAEPIPHTKAGTQVELERVRTGIAQGVQRLRSGVDALGEKLTPEELEMIRRGVKRGNARAAVLNRALREMRQISRPVEADISSEVRAQAEAEMRGAVELGESMDRPGRYFAENDPGEYTLTGRARIQQGERPAGTWYGVTATKHIIAEQFPWFDDPAISTSVVKHALGRGKGAEYERIVQKVADSIEKEAESSRAVVEEYAPRLRELADQVREIDPERAEILTDLAEGRAGHGLSNLRDYVERNIEDAQTAREFSRAVDQAAAEARAEAGIAETAGPADRTHRAENVLPGLEDTVAEQQSAASRYQAEQLTEQLNRPAESIEPAAGEMERKSPLFRGTEASPQREMFSKGRPRAEDEGTLYANPLIPITQAYTKHVGEPLWRAGEILLQKAIGKLPESWRPWLITRYGQPAKYASAARQRLTYIGEGTERARELGERLGRGLSQQEQRALGRFIKGEFDERELRLMRDDPRFADAIEAAKVARSEMDTLGGQAVMQGLLSQETFFRNYGKYMPRLYQRHELNYEDLLRKFGEKKPTTLDLSRFKRREDIPEEVRALMGEIEEPAYPVAKGISQLTHDVETARLFNLVADRPEWVSAEPRPGFVQMPESKKLGRLSGQFVQRHIADDINQIIRSRSEGEKIYRALLSEWKYSKVVLNPATHGRNTMSNTILAYLGGLPPTRVDIYAVALKDLRRQGRWYREAKQTGLLESTYARAELDLLFDSWNKSTGSLTDRLATMAKDLREGQASKAVQQARPSHTRIGRKLANLYQGEEQWFKLAKYIHNRERGMGVREAAADAEKWLFNYQEVPKLVDWARTSPFGAPFITFTYKALPVVMESAVKYPWRIGAIVALLNAMQEQSKQGMTEAQKRQLERVLPKRMKGEALGAPNFVLLPYKDRYGRLQYLDLSYILPWGDIAETGATGLPNLALSNPLTRAAVELGGNKSLYTGREIFRPTDTAGEKAGKVGEYLWRQAMPALAPGGASFGKLERAVTGEPDYFGRTRPVPSILADALLGLRTTPIDPRLEARFRQRELQEQICALRSEAASIQRDQRLSAAVKRERLARLRDKVRKIIERQSAPRRPAPTLRPLVPPAEETPGVGSILRPLNEVQ